MQRNKLDLITKAAILYYDKNLQQRAIAEKLCISRSYVSQLLSAARERNIVEIIIHTQDGADRNLALEVDTETKFPALRQAYILNQTLADAKDGFARFCAEMLIDLINDNKVIGVNPAVSVVEAFDHVDRLDISDPKKKKIVQIMGGLDNRSENMQSGEMVGRAASAIGCNAYYLHCPALFENLQMRNGILQEPGIKDTVKYWDKLDMTIMGLGVASRKNRLYEHISPQMQEELVKAGVKAELNLNFLDGDGNSVPMLDNNKMCCSYEQLKRVKNKVVITRGAHKAPALAAALKSGMIDTLLTDELTVEALGGL